MIEPTPGWVTDATRSIEFETPAVPQGDGFEAAAGGHETAGLRTGLTASESYAVAVEKGLADDVRQLFRG